MPLRSLIIVLIAMAVVPLTVIGLSWNPFVLGAGPSLLSYARFW